MEISAGKPASAVAVLAWRGSRAKIDDDEVESGAECRTEYSLAE